MRLFNTRGILQDINIISRQIKARTVSGVKIPDMIGVDAEGNVVIIENKNVTVDEKIIAQVLEYAIWAETNPDSLKNIWLEAAPEGVEPDWDNLQIRIIVVAPEIKKHLVRFVGKIGYQTDLFELKRYVIDNNEFLLVNQLEPERLVSKTVHTTQEWGFDYYRTEHNRESVKQMEKVVALVDSFVKKNGWELEKKFNKHYVGYKYGFPNVMGVNWLGSRSFGLYFKLPDEPKSVPKNIKGLEYRQYSDRWKQLEYKVTAANFDINKIKPLVEAAYKNIKGE